MKNIKNELPEFVVVENGDWYVKRSYPTNKRYKNGRRIYIQPKKRCLPETPERAKVLAELIDDEYRLLIQKKNVSVISFRDLCEQFLDAKKGSVTNRTLHGYTDICKRYLYKGDLPDKPLSEINAYDLQQHYKLCGSASMVKKVNTMASMIFEQGVRWGLCAENPTKKVIKPSAPRPEIKWIEHKKIPEFLKICKSDPKFFVYEFALETGMRPQEYAVLKWSDINLLRGIVHVRRALETGVPGQAAQIKDVKTKSGRRNIRISRPLCRKLIAHKRLQKARIELLLKKAEPPAVKIKKGKLYQRRVKIAENAGGYATAYLANDFVFPNTKGEFYLTSSFGNRVFKELINKAGTDISPYSLRHTMATLLAMKGASLPGISKRLGHSKTSFTMDTYVHAMDFEQERIAEIMESELHV